MRRGSTARLARPVALVAGLMLLAGCATPSDASAPTPGPVSTASRATPAPSPPSSPAADDVVPVAPPTHLSFAAAGIDGRVDEYTADDAKALGGINPPGLDSIVWYSGIPDAVPGSAATNTVYVFGHSWVEPAVFNGLADVDIGDVATLTTANGTLTYAVDEVISMSKSDFTQDERVAAIVPGRLALVTCQRPDGWDRSAPAPDNAVVFLHLVGATAAA